MTITEPTPTQPQTQSQTPAGSQTGRRISRRKVLAGAGALGVATVAGPRLAFATPSNPAQGDALVVVFLRGGADGLSMTPPHGYQSYRDLRPTIAIPPPGEVGGALPLDSSNTNAVFPTGIDGVVGMHPAMAPIYDTMWNSGNLAVIPAVGLPASESRTRSHFSAERYWERGSAASSVRTGWLNRMLSAQGAGALPGVGKNSQAMEILDGPAKTLAVNDLRNFGIGGFRNGTEARQALAAIHQNSSGSITATGSELLSVVDSLDALNWEATRDRYPDRGVAREFHDVAVMLRSGLGLRAAAIDFGGWDHHGELGSPGDTDGRFWRRASELAIGLRAFTDDLASDGAIDEVTILVITEFGRTINENGSAGTDHGRATTIMAMGGGVQGGVFGDDYPDVIADDPDEGDLTVLTDFRKPVSELIGTRVGVGNVFPTFTPPPDAMGLARP